MEYEKNLPTRWSEFFPSEVSFSPRKPWQFLKAMGRPVYSREVGAKFRKLLDEFQPDVVHLNNIHTQLSPIIAQIAHDRGIRFVWTLHDYKLLCPKYDCLREGKPCELCFNGKKTNVLKHSCVKGSRIASIIAWLEAVKWSREKLESSVDAFICPSRFMKAKMAQGGYRSEKLHALHNFFDPKKLEGDLPEKKDHYCYVGRLSEEKGIKTLLKVAAQLPYTLKVLGTGPLEAELREEYSNHPQIEFLGHVDWVTIKSTLGAARCSVLVSEWYENCPLSILESLALNTPVIGANIGGIPEMIKVPFDGSIIEPGDEQALKLAIVEMFGSGRNCLPPNLNTQAYLDSILRIYQS